MVLLHLSCPLLRLQASPSEAKRLTQDSRGALLRGRTRLRPLRVPLLRSVSVAGALGAVAGGGRTPGGSGASRPRVGHALYQRGATQDEGIVREIRRRCRISGGRQSMGEGRALLEENESEVKVVGAAADHPGEAVELDARLDGECCSDDD